MRKKSTVPNISPEEFLQKKKELNHNILILKFYNNEDLCTVIYADYTDKTLCHRDYTDRVMKTAFGNNHNPDWEAYNMFLEERCIPRTRAGLRYYLDAIGVDEFDPLEIIKKTKGRMAEDQQWIEVEEIK